MLRANLELAWGGLLPIAMQDVHLTKLVIYMKMCSIRGSSSLGLSAFTSATLPCKRRDIKSFTQLTDKNIIIMHQ